MRIGLFTDSYLPRADGIAISVESFRIGLESLGHEVYIFCPKRPEHFTEPNNRIYRFFSMPSLTYEQYRDTFPFMPNHIREVSKLNLDIVHTFTQTQIGLFGAYIAHRNHIPLVTTCSADFDLVNSYKRLFIAPSVLVLGVSMATMSHLSEEKLRLFFKPTYPWRKWLDRSIRVAAGFYNDQCDLTLVPSLKTQKAIEPFMKQRPVILACGTDLGLVPDHVSVEIYDKYGIPKEKTLFISASRLVREKRIEFVLRAYAKLSSGNKQKSCLVIIGDGPDAAMLKKLAETLQITKNVIFIGRVEHKQVLEIINACDIYLHASLLETQGLVLNEAAACGKPLVMIDRQANTILQEGKNGFYSANTHEDFGRKMTLLLEDKQLRSRFGKESQKLAKATDLKIVAKRLVSLYKPLIQN